MSMSVAKPNPQFSIGALPVLVALITVFVLGALSGYLVKPSSTVASPSASQRQSAATACPAGTHVMVWYTAHTWACVSDAG